MQIKDAYIVRIDFDGDIDSHFSFGQTLVFAGDNALEEVKAVLKEALTDLLNHRHEMAIEISGYDMPIADVLTTSGLLDAFIEQGGSKMGNWEIIVERA